MFQTTTEFQTLVDLGLELMYKTGLKDIQTSFAFAKRHISVSEGTW